MINVLIISAYRSLEPLCLTKGHMDNPEGQVDAESPLIGSYFCSLRKIFFFKKCTFNKASDLQALYLSKIGPGKQIQGKFTEIKFTEASILKT